MSIYTHKIIIIIYLFIYFLTFFLTNLSKFFPEQYLMKKNEGDEERRGEERREEKSVSSYSHFTDTFHETSK